MIGAQAPERVNEMLKTRIYDNLETYLAADEPTEAEKTVAALQVVRREMQQGAETAKSAWERGVYAYAVELTANAIDRAANGDFAPQTGAELKRVLLNGASDWTEYSYGGCSLIYDGDIAERLCTPSELRRTRGGERRPNAREEWLDTQARALLQASHKIKAAYFGLAAIMGRGID
mgnify:CR=1 FL=1